MVGAEKGRIGDRRTGVHGDGVRCPLVTDGQRPWIHDLEACSVGISITVMLFNF